MSIFLYNLRRLRCRRCPATCPPCVPFRAPVRQAPSGACFVAKPWHPWHSPPRPRLGQVNGGGKEEVTSDPTKKTRRLCERHLPLDKKSLWTKPNGCRRSRRGGHSRLKRPWSSIFWLMSTGPNLAPFSKEAWASGKENEQSKTWILGERCHCRNWPSVQAIG